MSTERSQSTFADVRDMEVVINVASSHNQWIGPVYSLGQLVGGLIAAFFLDKLGRKPTLCLGAICMEVSTALLVWSPSFGVVIAARVIEGVSIGFLLLGYQVSSNDTAHPRAQSP